MLGFIIGTLILVFLFIMIVSALVSTAGSQEVIISDKSVLHIRLDQEIKERSSKNPFEQFSFSDFEAGKQPGLNEILRMLKNAARDPKITGIMIDLPQFNSGLASAQELRKALLTFKQSGKFIYAYADYYTQGSYYIACTADKIYLNPQGQVLLTGLASQIAFFKGTMEKLEIEPEVIRHGKFKSAVEPFLLEKMSDENRQQVAAFIDPIWKKISGDICKSRRIPEEQMKAMVDSMLVRSAEDALRMKLVDKIAYYDEFSNDIRLKTGTEKKKELPLVSLNRYNKAPEVKEKNKTFPKDKIAVIYAVGSIENGKGDDETIGSDRLAEAIRKARRDEKVKAIVMRVNSPGGDALASEEIWREVILARKSKPFIVSMGDLAASGGYYISCAADKIVAQPNTLTGSIGVFGLLFNGEKMMRNKLGVTFDTYKTSPYTDMGTFTRAMTSSERTIMQQEVDRIYNVFTSRVAEGRHMKQALVDSIGQGRVWSGETALRIGLVDTLGGLQDAIAIAARKAGISEYRTTQLPEQKDLIMQVMEDMAAETRTSMLKEETGPAYEYLKALKGLMRLRGIQAFTPLRAGFN